MDLKKIFVVGTAGFVIVCIGLFYVLTNSLNLRATSGNQLDYAQVESKLRVLEAAMLSHKKTMKELENVAFGVADETAINEPQIAANIDDHDQFGQLDHDLSIGKAPFGSNDNVITSDQCSAAVGLDSAANPNINMLSVYDLLKFDNPNGGVWKQGWDVQIDENRFTDSNKLRVFIIPHSHNDPGWIKTFEKYFEDQTKNILNSMLDKLSSNSTLKFIWAEISYFDLWWKTLSDVDKVRVKRIVENKQLEFVTGGWVMPDESSSHYYSILTQLIEGHQWLLNHLGYIPRNAWSIDPFGMSPTMAYFLRRTGLTNMVIQRTHYSVKKHLAQLQELEFKWRQLWDSHGSADMLCHMMPFYSYDVPHTCGPNPKICCQFDFKRMHPVSSLSCPWNAPPQPIIYRNVRERATTLLDQYRKKAMLYKTNVLLVPLGDDFRWENNAEWDAQVSNYGKIFEYVNSQPDLNAEVKFATLEDYFKALNEEIANDKFSPSVLSGDFFTYADRDDHYWSGYFTSRPFHKAMDRELMGHLRAAHIAFSLMSAEVSKQYGGIPESPFVKNLLGKLIKARRHLSLFQHHDGVAGTSKDHVMADYASMLYDGLNNCNHVLQQSLQVLTHLSDPTFDVNKISDESVFYDPAISKEHHTTLPHYNLLIIDREMSQRLVTVFNPDARIRTQLVTLYVSTYQIKVVDLNETPLEFEILPVFDTQTTLSRNVFQLNFVAEMEPLALKSFFIKFSETSDSFKPEITLINSPARISNSGRFIINEAEDTEPISISNEFMTVNFGQTGFVESLVINGQEHDLSIGMFKYGAKKRPETSGLYIFIPDGKAVPLQVFKPLIKVVKGKFQSYVEVWLTQVKHRVTIYNHPGFERYSLDVKNLIDIRQERNFELMMKIKTNIKSEDTSYTDLNAFQMIRRRNYDKLPLQAKYYPLPSSTYIEDSTCRLTLLSAQPVGTASLASGEIEVIMDRRLNQDDNRGAEQGALDNVETMSSFKLMFESLVCHDKNKEQMPPMLSLASHITLQDMLHPFRTFTGPMETKEINFSGTSDYSPSPFGLPCDVQLVDATPLPSYENSMDDSSFIPTPQAALLLRRVGYDGRFFGGIPLPKCRYDDVHLGHFNLKDLMGTLFQPKIQQKTLSFVHNGKVIASNDSVLMQPMEVYGFLVQFHSVSLDNEVNNSPFHNNIEGNSLT